MMIKVEVSQNHDCASGPDVRTAELLLGTVIGFGGHGKGKYAQVMTRRTELFKVKCPGGYWTRSGDKFVCIDLDHAIGNDQEYTPWLSSDLWFEPSEDEGAVIEIWTTWEAVKVVRDAESESRLTEHVRSVPREGAKIDVGAVENAICTMIEEGTLPHDGIERLRKEGLLTKGVCELLDKYGILHR